MSDVRVFTRLHVTPGGRCLSALYTDRKMLLMFGCHVRKNVWVCYNVNITKICIYILQFLIKDLKSFFTLSFCFFSQPVDQSWTQVSCQHLLHSLISPVKPLQHHHFMSPCLVCCSAKSCSLNVYQCLFGPCSKTLTGHHRVALLKVCYFALYRNNVWCTWDLLFLAALSPAFLLINQECVGFTLNYWPTPTL